MDTGLPGRLDKARCVLGIEQVRHLVRVLVLNQALFEVLLLVLSSLFLVLILVSCPLASTNVLQVSFATAIGLFVSHDEELVKMATVVVYFN